MRKNNMSLTSEDSEDDGNVFVSAWKRQLKTRKNVASKWIAFLFCFTHLFFSHHNRDGRPSPGRTLLAATCHHSTQRYLLCPTWPRRTTRTRIVRISTRREHWLERQWKLHTSQSGCTHEDKQVRIQINTKICDKYRKFTPKVIA